MTLKVQSLGRNGKGEVVTFHGRRAESLENGLVRVTVLAGGGHLAEITLLENGVNPLWIPPWPTIEPRDFDPQRHAQYGTGPEGRLLAGIMGHNLCFDFFGSPSEQEAAAGLTVHGEASVVDWEIRRESQEELRATASLPLAGMRVERRLRLAAGVQEVAITETAENLTAVDRPVGWTQHVTLGPPFVAPGRTALEVTATRSKTFEADFAEGKGRMRVGAEFDWPWCPATEGDPIDLRVASGAAVSAGYTAHLMDPAREEASFTAYNPELAVEFGYRWRRADFPWLGIWEENHAREHPPWNGRTVTRGMEFGVSPMPESRRQMVRRGSLFGTPAYRWIPARGRVTVEYRAWIRRRE